MLEAYLRLLEQGYYEVTFAFEGLADEHVWKRPAPGLLSVGELAGHVAYWEAIRLASDGLAVILFGEGEEEPDLAKCRVSSPLIDNRFRYYSTTLATAPSEQHRAMTAEQVCSELLRVHEESAAHFKALNPDLGSTPPGWSPPNTYGGFLEYLVFHIAYHTGQMYSARHLLGEQTPDN
jgi:hypothetical protein